MSFSVRGASALTGLASLSYNFRRGVLGGGSRAVQIITDRAREGMTSGPHSGTHWQTSFRTRGFGAGRQVFPVPGGLPNRSSAPGEYAATQSGAMLGGIGGRNSLTQMQVWIRAPHAGYVEYGTDRMGARPTMSNAIRDTHGQVEAVLGQTVWQYVFGG